MKKLLSSLATFTLIASSTATSVVACGSGHSTAQKEANNVDDQTVYLNDTTVTYENQTATDDQTAIRAELAKDGYINVANEQDFTFGNTNLKVGTNSNIAFYVNAPDGSQASGNLNIVINDPAYTPTKAQPTLAKTEADKMNNKTITLNDSTTTTYENKTIQQDTTAIKNALFQNEMLTHSELANLSFPDKKTLLTAGTNKVNFTMKGADKSTATGTLNVKINTLQIPTTPSTVMEDPTAIANKLKQASVKLDPTFWLNKNIQDYQTQLNDQLVAQGLLTKLEASTLVWNPLQINIAGYYYSQASFTVHAAGKTVKGTTTINASTGETPTQIAGKINAAGDNAHCNIRFNYAWWKGKRLSQNLAMFRSILVNENILTVAEASIINGMPFDNPPYPNFLVPLKASLNDGNTTATTDPVTASIYYVTDGSSAQTIASELTNKTVNLSLTQWQNKSIVQNIAQFRADLVNQKIMSVQDAQYVLADGETWAITKTDKVTNLTFAVQKDGQIYNATNVTLNITK